MDPAVTFLISLGYTTKELHDSKPSDKINYLCKSYGFKNAPKLSRRQCAGFLKDFLALENKNKESFEMLFRLALNKHLIKYMPKNNEHELVISNLPAKKFYQSPEWRKLRYQILEKYGNKCFACGRSPKKDNVVIHIDHILPRSIYPEHALAFSNMQVLCEDCNMGKSNKYESNWKR